MTQHHCSAASKKLTDDRFLVQLAKLNQPLQPNKQMTPEDISRLWDSIGKQGLTQYKLKVDLNADVLELIDRDPTQQPAGGVAPGLTPATVNQSELFHSVSTKIADTQLDHTVGAVKATKGSAMDPK